MVINSKDYNSNFHRAGSVRGAIFSVLSEMKEGETLFLIASVAWCLMRRFDHISETLPILG